MSLKFTALSGTTGVTENLYVYEYGSDLIIVDCGVGFPEAEMLGVDLIIPDFTYLKENRSRFKAIFITHGHEDHIGALPYLLEAIGPRPIYCTKLVAGFIRDKLSEHKLPKVDLRVFNPEKDTIKEGHFQVTPFRISHSVPDAVGYCIETPEGKSFHVADFKFDWTPVDGRPFDVGKVALLAREGVLTLASDCLGSTSQGYTESEVEIEKRILEIANNAKGQILFTTISSNISRVKQALNVAEKLGKKVAFIGRSIDRKARIAKELGYLEYPDNLVVSLGELRKKKPSERMIIISGSYGQQGSALYRASLGEHKQVTIHKGDIVIFSSDPGPPGSKDKIDYIVDRLIELSVEVHYYDMQEDLHVSGHGSIKDIEMLFVLVRPQYYIPIGGTIRSMHAAKKIATSIGISENNVFELGGGDVVEFEKGVGKRAGRVPARSILIDGLGIGDVGNVVLRDRQILAKDGIAIALLKVDLNAKKLIENPEIISRGFVFQGKKQKLLDEASNSLVKELAHLKAFDMHILKDRTIDFLERFFFEKTGRRPMILPVIAEV